MKKEIRTFVRIVGMMILFPLWWAWSKRLRDDFRLYSKDKVAWQDRQAEVFAHDFIRDYKEILDKFD
jgi:hypothetical protein